MRSFIITSPVLVQSFRSFSFDPIYIQKLLRLRQMSKRHHLNEIGELSLSVAAKAACAARAACATKMTSNRFFAGESTKRPFTNVEVAKKLSEELTARGIDVVIGGSMAVGMIASPRQTKDIDVNISAIPKETLENILRTMEGADLTKFTYLSSMVPKSRSLVATENTMATFGYKGWPIDAFVCPEPKDVLRKRIFEKPLIEDGLKFVCPECMCVMKMLSLPGDHRYRKDRTDIQSLLESAENLELEWIREELVLRDGHNGPRVKEWDQMVKEVQDRKQE